MIGWAEARIGIDQLTRSNRTVERLASKEFFTPPSRRTLIEVSFGSLESVSAATGFAFEISIQGEHERFPEPEFATRHMLRRAHPGPSVREGFPTRPSCSSRMARRTIGISTNSGANAAMRRCGALVISRFSRGGWFERALVDPASVRPVVQEVMREGSSSTPGASYFVEGSVFPAP